MCVSEPVLSQDCKNDIFMGCLKMLKIALWKNDLIYGYRFWAICLPKIDISTLNLACQMSRHGSTTYCTLFLGKIWKFWILLKVIYKFFFFTSWVIKSFFGESEIAVLKNFLLYGFCCFILVFCLKYLYLVIFQTPIFDEKWRDIGSLKSV